ncbi:MAG: signal peptidase I, partial [bacterium]|nr:signal peptidase I [bacterium]
LMGIIYFIPKILVYALDSQYPVASIASGSMWPALKQGDLVFIKGVHGKDDVFVGDIVVYRTIKGFTIHRVVEKGDDRVLTKGDANNSSDSPVYYDQIVGKTVDYNGKPVKIPYLGSISLILRKD